MPFLGKGSGFKIKGSEIFSNCYDMEEAYKGTVTDFVKTNKLKYSLDTKNGLIRAEDY